MRKKCLFYILHLFAHLFDQHLELDRDSREFTVDRFGSECVRLAVQLLHQEIEPLAACPAAGKHTFDFGKNKSSHSGDRSTSHNRVHQKVAIM